MDELEVLRRKVEERDEKIRELESALEKAEVAKSIIARTNRLLDSELFKSTIVAKVGEIAAHVLDYNEMVRRLMALVGRIAVYDAAALLVVHQGAARLSICLANDMSQSSVDWFARMVLDAYGRVAGTAPSLDVCEREVVTGEVRADAVDGPLQSYEGFALRVGDEPIGLIAMASLDRDAFGEGEIASFELIANQAVIVVDDAARHQALLESRRKIEGLHEVARHIEGCDAESDVYALTVSAAEDLIPGTRCSIDVIEEGAFVTAAASERLAEGQASALAVERAALLAEAHWSGRASVMTDPRDIPPGRRLGPCVSGVCLPIGEYGVLLATSAEPDALTEDDVRLLELLLGHTTEAVRAIRLRNELHEQAIRDPLTGAYNRRHFVDTMRREMSRSRRHGHPIGFLMVDVDHFKAINDTYGHQVGDEVLREVAEVLMRCTRAHDMVVRYGGDEFLVVLTETGNDAELARERIASEVLEWGESGCRFDFHVSLSIGSAYWDPDGPISVEQALQRADERMYEEKRGRSRSRAARISD